MNYALMIGIGAALWLAFDQHAKCIRQLEQRIARLESQLSSSDR